MACTRGDSGKAVVGYNAAQERDEGFGFVPNEARRRLMALRWRPRTASETRSELTPNCNGRRGSGAL
jgi:hypothetical protein